MYRKLPSFLALVLLSSSAFAETHMCDGANGEVVFSDTPCASDGAFSVMSSEHEPDPEPRPETNPLRKEIYTKEITPLQSPDAATQACFNHVNTTSRFPDPSATKLLSSSKKWVTVKDVGGRQMVTIGVTSKNEAGMYLGVQSFDCLLMGDNATVNTGAYELL